MSNETERQPTPDKENRHPRVTAVALFILIVAAAVLIFALTRREAPVPAPPEKQAVSAPRTEEPPKKPELPPEPKPAPDAGPELPKEPAPLPAAESAESTLAPSAAEYAEIETTPATADWPLAGIARPYTGQALQPRTAEKPAPVYTIPAEPEASDEPPALSLPQPVREAEPAPAYTAATLPEPPAVPREPVQEPAEGPYISLDSPAEGDYYGDQIRISGKIWNSPDDRGETDNVLGLYWKRSGAGDEARYILFEEDGSFVIDIDARTFSGTVELTITAEDMLRNQSVTSLSLKDGRLEPKITIQSPSSGDAYGLSFYLRGRVDDPYSADPDYGGIERVEYRISSLQYQEGVTDLTGSTVPDASGMFSFEIDSSRLSGTQQLAVTAVARNGTESVASLNLIQGQIAIAGLSVETGDGMAVADWRALPFTSGYTVELGSGDFGGERRNLRSFEAAEPPLTIRNLQNGHQYTVKVRTEIHGRTVESAGQSIIPLSPDLLRPTIVSDYQRINLSWPPIPGTDRFDIYRAASASGSEAEKIAAEISGTRFVDYEALFGREYFYAVKPSSVGSILSGYARGASLEAPVKKLEIINTVPEFSPGSLVSVGGYIFFAGRTGDLRIIDVSLPGSLSPIGTVPSEGAFDLSVLDDYAFLAEGERGYKIFNIADPRTPFEIIRVKTVDARAIAAGSGYLYIADGPAGLKVISAADVLDPYQVYREETPEARDVSLAGSRLYLLTASGLAIYSTATPERPERLGVLSLDEPKAFSISENGSYAYIVGEKGALVIVDVRNEANPVVIGELPLPGALGVEVRKDFAYVPVESGGFRVIDVRNPETPYEFDRVPGGRVSGITIQDSTIFTIGEDGLQRFSAYLYGQSYEVNSLHLDSVAHRLNLHSGILEVSHRSAGMTLIPIGEAPHRDSSGYLSLSGTSETSISWEDYTLTAAGDAGIAVYSTADPESGPLYTIPTEGMAVDVHRYRNILAVSLQNRGVALYDSPEPPAASAALRAAALVESPDPRDLAFSGNLMILADFRRGVTVIDISSAENPRTVATGGVDGIKSAAAYADILFTAGLDGIGAFRLDASSGLSPLFFLELPFVEKLIYDGTYLYAAQGIHGVKVIDPWPELGPRIVSECGDIYAVDILVDRNLAYVASGRQVKVIQIVIPPWLRSEGPGSRP
jgi:hypothetical protein